MGLTSKKKSNSREMENLPVRLLTWFALIFDLTVTVAGLQKNNDFPLLNHAMLIHPLFHLHHHPPTLDELTSQRTEADGLLKQTAGSPDN